MLILEDLVTVVIYICMDDSIHVLLCLQTALRFILESPIRELEGGIVDGLA